MKVLFSRREFSHGLGHYRTVGPAHCHESSGITLYVCQAHVLETSANRDRSRAREQRVTSKYDLLESGRDHYRALLGEELPNLGLSTPP
jgi:hypothetical protein